MPRARGVDPRIRGNRGRGRGRGERGNNHSHQSLHGSYLSDHFQQNNMTLEEVEAQLLNAGDSHRVQISLDNEQQSRQQHIEGGEDQSANRLFNLTNDGGQHSTPSANANGAAAGNQGLQHQEVGGGFVGRAPPHPAEGTPPGNVILPRLRSVIAHLYSRIDSPVFTEKDFGKAEALHESWRAYSSAVGPADRPIDYDYLLSLVDAIRTHALVRKAGGLAIIPAASPEDSTPPSKEWVEDNRILANMNEPWNVPLKKSKFRGKLADCALTPFSGKVQDYLGFRTNFIHSVHGENVEMYKKHNYLKSLLQEGQAKEFANSIQVGKQGYVALINQLDTNYGDPQTLYNVRYQEMLQFRDISFNNLKKLNQAIQWCTNVDQEMPFYPDNVSGSTKMLARDLWARCDSLLQDKIHDKYPDGFDLKELEAFFKKRIPLLGQRDAVKSFLKKEKEEDSSAEKPRKVSISSTSSSKSKSEEKKQQGGKRRKNLSKELRCTCENDCAYISECPGFNGLPVNQKLQHVKKNELCSSCLRGAHPPDKCKYKEKCAECNGAHHTILHNDEKKKQSANTSHLTMSEDDSTEAEHNASGNMVETSLLKKDGTPFFGHVDFDDNSECLYAQVIVRNPKTGKDDWIWALLDGGASHHCISQRVVDKLKLLEVDSCFKVTSAGNVAVQINPNVTELKVASVDGEFGFQTPAIIFPEITNRKAPDWEKIKVEFPEIKDIDFRPTFAPHDRKIDMIIGRWTPKALSILKEIHTTGPTAYKTMFGWSAAGPTQSKKTPPTNAAARALCRINVHTLHAQKLDEIECDEMTADEEQFVKEISNLQPLNEMQLNNEDLQAMQIIGEGMVFEDGHYYVPCLWRSEERPSGNYDFAKHRLDGLVAALDKKGLFGAYDNQIQNWKAEGHVRRVFDKRDVRNFIPHFAVLRPDNPTSPLRIVMDSKTKSYDGRSLNDYLLPGAHVYGQLDGVLTRFRFGPYAFATDVRHMFLFFRMLPEDRQYVCFLWKNKETGEIEMYEFAGHCFGKCDSPSVTVSALKLHVANDIPGTTAAFAVSQQSVVDDILYADKTKEMTRDCFHKMKNSLHKCGLILHKTRSNFNLTEEDSESDEIAIGAKNEEVGTLGVSWNTKTDRLSLKKPKLSEPKKWTKTNVLSILHSLYDPNGYAGPVTAAGRMMFQDTWIDKIDWKDLVSDDLKKKVRKWIKDLDRIEEVSLEREVERDSSSILHVFADASKYGFGAVAYLQTGQKTYLIQSKSRVAPVRPVTIPRLELEAALLAANLGHHLVKVCGLGSDNVRYYSDSEVVLSWMYNPPRHLQEFAANRLQRILDLTKVSRWAHVRSELNPADLLTRPCSVDVLLESSLWWNGPAFIKENTIPPQPRLPIKFEEWSAEAKKEASQRYRKIKGYVSINAISVEEDSVSPQYGPLTLERTIDDLLQSNMDLVRMWIDGAIWRFSTWERIRAAVAGIIVLFHNRRGIKCAIPRPLLLKIAENAILRESQETSFPKTIQALEDGNQIRDKNLLQVSPFLDEHGVMRVGSRMQFWETLDQDARTPVILHRDNILTKFLLEHMHAVELNHCGDNQYLLSHMRRRFWISKVLPVIKNLRKRCVVCQRSRALHQPFDPTMAPLPDRNISEDRAARPFQQVHLDFAGPFRVVVGEDKKGEDVIKSVFVLVIVCRFVRACRFVICESTSADSAAMAFERFTAEFGCPDLVISDNATCFIGIQAELERLQASVWSLRGRRQFQFIEWQTTSPLAPFENGTAEVMVRSMKRAVFKILRGSLVAREEFETVLKKAESILNKRPLTAFNTQEEAICPLRPCDFFAGSVSTSVFNREDLEGSLFERFKKTDEMIQQVWRRYILDYLPTLHEKSKWSSAKNVPSVGDIVLVLDKKTALGSYPLARIVELFTNKDGEARSARIRLGNSILRRSVRNLAPVILPSDDIQEALATMEVGNSI